MKNLITLLGMVLGVSPLVHAIAPQISPVAPKIVDSRDKGIQQPIATEPKTLNENEAEKIGAGSGDDVDTIDEADPANDKDPEADDDSDSGQ